MVLEELERDLLEQAIWGQLSTNCSIGLQKTSLPMAYHWKEDEEAIANLELEEAKQFYRKYYRPG